MLGGIVAVDSDRLESPLAGGLQRACREIFAVARVIEFRIRHHTGRIDVDCDIDVHAAVNRASVVIGDVGHGLI